MTNNIVEKIRAHHRQRRFAMGIQQVLDRKLESYIRINYTAWEPDADDKVRTKANREVTEKIKLARQEKGDADVIHIVAMTDDARAPADSDRVKHEKEMERLAAQLPIAAWVEKVPGLGLLGVATILAETGDLSKYPNVAKVWKRLGYAPYDGHAGSTWKRDTWRPRSLDKQEWIDNPFSGRRYAMIHTIGVWLKNHQWIGAAKTGDGVGKPNGKYGAVYARRRARTAKTHPDWSKQHSHMDALRIMMKEVLKDLWVEWHRSVKADSPARIVMKSNVALPGSPKKKNGRHIPREAHVLRATASPANFPLKPTTQVPGIKSRNGRRSTNVAHNVVATASPAKLPVKPNRSAPGSPKPRNGRQLDLDARVTTATARSPAKADVKSSDLLPGSPKPRNGRRHLREAQSKGVTVRSPVSS